MEDYDYDGILYSTILQQDMVKCTLYEDVRNRVDDTFGRTKCQPGNLTTASSFLFSKK